MVRLRLVERIDGDWCAYVEGHEDDAIVAPTDEAALGRLVRAQYQRIGIEAITVTALDSSLSGEPAARFPAEPRAVGPDSEAPEIRRPGGNAPEA